MPAKILDGKKLAQEKNNALKLKIDEKIKLGYRPPSLAVILIGNDSASEIYVNKKAKACKQVGINSLVHKISATINEKKLLKLIKNLNEAEEIDGILIQLPLPWHINQTKIITAISPLKDVDGFHPYNVGCLATRMPSLKPCTPAGIMELLQLTQKPTHGMECVIIGASNIVGRPLALEMLLAGCTVTICHRFTKNINAHISRAECLVAAVGKPKFIDGNLIKKDAIVIDVGINRMEDGQLIGDIDFETASQKASWITPVPGGVGPMTIAKLLENTFYVYEINNLKK